MNQNRPATGAIPITQNATQESTAKDSHNIFNKINYSYLIAGLVSLILGYLFYVIFRQYDPLALGIINTELFESSNTFLPFSLQYSTPSFIHVISLSLIHLSFLELKQKNIIAIALFWSFANIGYEILQSPSLLGFQFVSGTSDLMDMLFALIGGLFFTIVISQIEQLKPKNTSSIQANLSKRQKNILFCCVVLLGTGTMLGCDGQTEANPIYLSYEELRSPLVINEEGPLTLDGTPYINESILLINNKNEGLHIFDNSDPENPIYQKYIQIPGVTDMEIKDGFLYANSYIDLLVIDINDINNINLARRHENFFAYNPHQSIPSYVILLDLDISKGVVVDYEIVLSGDKS